MGLLPFEKREQKVIDRTRAATSPKYGQRPGTRTTAELLRTGIVVIDKPAGPTSHQVSAYARQILGLARAGHSGTLDPGVTGVLPVALEQGTRIVQSLLTAGKEYVCLMHLHQPVADDQLRAALDGFVGKIRQLPPIKSAVKRQWRYRKVYYLEVLDIQGQDVLFRVGCQAGTYIRKLVHDIGQALGVGAHMAELRRTKAAAFTEAQAVTLQDLADAFHYAGEGDDTKLRRILLPIEAGVQHLAKVWVNDTAVDPLCHGMQLKLPGILKVDGDIQKEDIVAVMTLKDELVLVGQALMASREMLAEKGIATRTLQVFMKPGTYPRTERA